MSDKIDAELNLKKFNMAIVGDDKVCVFIGKRKTGKSVGVKDLLYHNRHIPSGVVISGTENANKFYGRIIPEQYIHDAFDEDLTDNIILRQVHNIDMLREQYPDLDDDEFDKIKKDANIGCFIVLDDLMFDQKWVRNKTVAQLFMNGRHYKILFIVTMQYPLGILPGLRTNVDYVFIFRENNISNRRKIYEHYAGIFPTFDMFCQVMDACTNDYGCLVIDNNAKGTKVEDVVYWYRASEHKDFPIGSSEFRNYGKTHHNTYKDDEYYHKKQKKLHKKQCNLKVQKDSHS